MLQNTTVTLLPTLVGGVIFGRDRFWIFIDFISYFPKKNIMSNKEMSN